MSRAQWGHGYWRGRSDAMLRWPIVCGCLHVWHWRLRHCWLGNLRRPIQIDNARPAWISITVCGFTVFVR